MIKNKNYIVSICSFIMFIISINCYGHCLNWQLSGSPTDITGQEANDNAGKAIAINRDGKFIVVGEPGWDNNRGRVRVYNFDGSNWMVVGNATAMTGENLDDAAGSSVAISSDGKTVAFGEQGWNGNRGRVRVYRLINDAWTEIGSPTAMIGQNSDDRCGSSVAISSDGTIVTIGEYGWNNSRGRVRVYTFDGNNWIAMGGSTDMAGENVNDKAGFSVAWAEFGVVAIGEPGWSGDRGRVRVYILDGNNWVAFGDSTEITGDSFSLAGFSVVIDSLAVTIVVGEPGWNIYTGRARVYNLIGNTWKAGGSPTNIIGENSGDRVGNSVALMPDEIWIAVGEPGWNNNQGRVRIYRLIGTGGNFTVLTGENSDDETGWSIAMNHDGTIIAIAEPGWNNNRGRVQVVQYLNNQQIANYLKHKPLNLSLLTMSGACIEDMVPVYYICSLDN